jgi:hypothetical protein
MYIADHVLKTSFERLSSTTTNGKTGLERTSALMYFLAFDQLASKALKAKAKVIDLNPDTPRGQYNRSQFAAEYMNLVVVSQSPHAHIYELGKIATDGPVPEKRISANFFTTPLKRATQSASPQAYPKRPAAPLLLLGVEQGNSRWGVTRHVDWRTNLPAFLAGNNSKTPFTDLAIVLCRSHEFSTKKHVTRVELSRAIQSMFSDELTDAWTKHLLVESRRSACPEIMLQATRSAVLQVTSPITQQSEHSTSAVFERSRIVYLERLLAENGIPFAKEQ